MAEKQKKRTETKKKRKYTDLLFFLSSFTFNYSFIFKAYFLILSQTAFIFSNLTISVFLLRYLQHLYLIQLVIYSGSSYCISCLSHLFFSGLQLCIYFGEQGLCYSVYVAARGQLWELILSFYHMGIWFQTHCTWQQRSHAHFLWEYGWDKAMAIHTNLN